MQADTRRRWPPAGWPKQSDRRKSFASRSPAERNAQSTWFSAERARFIFDRVACLTALTTPPALENCPARQLQEEAPTFDAPDLASWLQNVDAADLDRLECGALGFDVQGILHQYNRVVSTGTGIEAARLLGQNVFLTVSPCMHNFMVMQRFEDTMKNGESLDEIVDFVLTWRMRPTHVRLRLIANPGQRLRYVLVERRVPSV